MYTSSESTLATFPELFRSYRVISGFHSLQQISDALNEEGIVIDPPELSRWQTGKRYPKDRKTILLLIKVFVRYKAIVSIKQANHFCASAGCGYLTELEALEFFDPKSLFFKTDEINQVRVLIDYYLDFLKQGKRGNRNYYSEIEKELEGILQTLDKAYEFKFYSQMLSFWEFLGIFLWDTGRWNEYEKEATRLIVISKLLAENNVTCKIQLEDLVWLYYWQGKTSLANQFLNSAKALITDQTTEEILNLFYLRSGVLSLSSGSIDQSITELWKAESFFNLQDDIQMAAKSSLYLGHAFESKNNLGEARKKYENSLKLSKTLNSEDQAKALYYLGMVSFKQGNYMHAENNFRLALEIDRKVDRQAGIAWNSLMLAQCIQGKQKRILALEAVQIFKKLKMTKQEEEAKSVAII